MNVPTTDTIEINAADPASVGVALQKVVDHIMALHMDVGLLSLTIGTLVNAGDAGLLAYPNMTRVIVSTLLENLGEKAPLAALQIGQGLDLPLGSPPKGRKRLKIVQGEKKAA
jgi:hypothetical protein